MGLYVEIVWPKMPKQMCFTDFGEMASSSRLILYLLFIVFLKNKKEKIVYLLLLILTIVYFLILLPLLFSSMHTSVVWYELPIGTISKRLGE